MDAIAKFVGGEEDEEEWEDEEVEEAFLDYEHFCGFISARWHSFWSHATMN